MATPQDPAKLFLQLQAKVEAAQRSHDKADGAFNQLAQQMKTEFGVSSLKEARTLLTKLEEQERTEAEAFTAAVDKLREEFPDVLAD